MIDHARKKIPPLFPTTDETLFNANVISFTGYAPRYSRLFCFDGTEQWARTCGVTVFASNGVHVTNSHEGSVDGSIFFSLDLQTWYPVQIMTHHLRHRVLQILY
jgi:hypothetical protein